MRTFTIALAAAVVSFAAVSPAFAAASDPSTQTVSYADLNLMHRADVAKLNRRVSAMIEASCGSYQNASQTEQDAIKSCRAGINSSLQPQLAQLIASQQNRLASR